MTPAQTKVYFREWGKARKVLIASGYEPKEADAERKQIHHDAGLPESSKRFNKTTHLDAFIAACRKICGKSDIDIKDQARKRLIHLIEQTGIDDPYLDHLAKCKHEATNWRALDPAKLRHLLITAKARAESKA